MSDSNNICISCGLCCDGTIIGFALVTKEESISLNGILEIESLGENGVFFQPCIQLGCGGCKVYEDRPNKCDEFKCKLLNSVSSEELTFEEASKAVVEIKEFKKGLLNKLTELPLNLQSKSFYFKLLEVKKAIINGSLVDSPIISDIEVDLYLFNKLISKHFGVTL